MSEQEIIEVNKLMAEFMGVPKHECSIPNCYEFGSRVFYSAEKMKYNSSWDWLMPVIDKIESLGYDTGICRINIKGEILSEVIISPVGTEDKHGKIEVHQRSAESKIDLTYNCINLFLNWYTDATRK